MFLIGFISTTFGIKGEVKVTSTTDYNRFKKGSTVFINYIGVEMPLIVERSRSTNNKIIVKFKGIDDINDVLKYKGLELYIKEIDKFDIKNDEFHYSYLIDKKVYSVEDKLLGVVKSILEVPRGHLLEINDLKEKTHLLPFIKEYVISITEDKIVVVDVFDIL